MTNAPIRILVILGAVTLVSIISLQVYWSISAVDSLEKQFSHNVKMSLNNVVESVCQINGADVPVRNPVEQVSNAYFIVRTNQPIQLQPLKNILTTEFENRAIAEDFEFGVYDCQSDRMIYGDFVSMTATASNGNPSQLPVLEDYDYYFGVFFPNHVRSFWSNQTWLQWSTLFTLLIFLFFAYAIFVLLRQKRLSAIQKDFINNIMHELKTPVSSLKIAAEVLSSQEIINQPQRLSRYSQLVKEESNRLESHIHQLLRTAELDEPNQVDFQSIDVPVFLKEIVSKLSYKAVKKRMLLLGDESVSIQSDAYYLETIIVNLIENGLKYGGDEVSIKYYRKGSYLFIEVWDNGKGIPIEEKNKVFQRFYRISTGDTHDVKGFGLGLYVVKKLVHLLEGEVSLISPKHARFQLKFRL